MTDKEEHEKTIADELLESMGEVKATVKMVNERQIVMDDKLNRMGERDVRLEASVQSAHKRIDDIHKDLKENIMPMVNDHEAYKNKGLGILGFIGFIFTTLGAFIAWAFSHATKILL